MCGYPMVWSVALNRARCCVYGDHKPPQPGPLMLAADDELHAGDGSVSTRFKRKDRDGA